ncbi:MAG TPA: HepT-like ribonuclease domain-containing protein [Tepidiformaceae bacterium]|nr:HepT-like ribonuclease domain-containing protein [Tepidiformaceae bacterium]
MSQPPEDARRLAEMLAAAETIVVHVRDMSLAEFEGDGVLRAAVLHWFSVIGEAASRVSEEGRDRVADIPWREVIGLRHRIVHDYLGVDSVMIFEIMGRDLPGLIETLRRGAGIDDAG